MFSFVTLLVAAKAVFGAPNGKSVSISLNKLGSPLAKNGMIIPEALARQTHWEDDKYFAGVGKFRPPKSPVSLFKRHHEPLEKWANGMLWSGQIEIGTPPQKLVVEFDTGSSDFWVLSSACVAPECSSGNKYDPSQSTSSKSQPGEFSITYAGGWGVSGPVYTETVTVAGLSAQGQVFSPVNQRHNMRNRGADGLMGLAFRSGSRLNAPTFIDNLLSQNKISTLVFSMRLSSTPGSELYIGGTNPSKYRDDITYVSLESQTYWIVKGAASANGQEGYNGEMLIDSSSDSIFGPEDSVKNWWSKVPESKPCPPKYCSTPGYFTLPCAKVPSVSFGFNSREFLITTESFILGKIRSDPATCIGAIRILHVPEHASPPKAWILGSRFMMNVYTVFDANESRLGFATPA